MASRSSASNCVSLRLASDRHSAGSLSIPMTPERCRATASDNTLRSCVTLPGQGSLANWRMASGARRTSPPRVSSRRSAGTSSSRSSMRCRSAGTVTVWVKNGRTRRSTSGERVVRPSSPRSSPGRLGPAGPRPAVRGPRRATRRHWRSRWRNRHHPFQLRPRRQNRRWCRNPRPEKCERCAPG